MKKLDVLNREEFVDKLVTLTENLAENRSSISFAINGAWGSGKSFVLDMYEEQLGLILSEKTALDKYFIIRYNCWKYDYYEEPLVAIVAAMIDIINQRTKLWNDENKKARVLGILKTVGTTLLSMVNDGVKDKTGIDIKSTYETLKTNIESEETKVEKSHEYDVYFSFNQALERLQKLITELGKEQTIIFMVDELDRCLPQYSIKVLERLHHLTENSNNVITVLSMDKKQLQKSVQQIFGFENPEKYLEKFIRFEIKLNRGEVSEKIVKKYKNYIDLFDKDKIYYDDSIEEFFKEVFRNIGAREQEQLIHRAALAHRLLFDTSKDYSFMCIEVLAVVLKSTYGGCKKFAKWFDNVHSVTYSGEQKPPFDSFFSERFGKCIDLRNYSFVTNYTSGNEVRTYTVKSVNLLYAHILYLWYNLYLKVPRVELKMENEEQASLMDRNVEDLKKYIKTIDFIG